MSDLPPLPKGFLVEPVPNETAVAWIRSKPAVSSSVFKRLFPELKSRALAVAGIESAGVLRDIREAIARVPAGADWDAEKRKIADLVHPYVSDPDDPKNKRAARRKAELLLRTHGFQGYAIGQHQVMRDQQDVFPWWQYLTMSDELVRPTHAALNKLILPASSPFWLKHSPPWDWGCRCRKVPLLPAEVDSLRQKEAPKPPEAKTVIEGEALRFLEVQGKLDRGPNKIFDLMPPSDKRPDAFLFEPDSLRLTPGQLESRYDPQTWSDFQAWAQQTMIGDGGASVWAWMEGRAPARFSLRPGARNVMTVEARRAEISGLIARLPRRKHPISAIFRSPDDDALSLTRRKAILLAEMAHDDGALPVCSMASMDASEQDCGDYSNGQIRIHPFSRQPILVTLHEMGHHIAKGPGVSRADIYRISQAVWDSERGKAIQWAVGKGADPYWLRDEECFCRVYSQWVVSTTNDPEAMAELQSVIASPMTTLYHWPEAEFEPLAHLMTQVITKAFP